ncbi:MAG: CRISPR-associated endonuclease Cas2 [Chloroflexota bacterium]
MYVVVAYDIASNKRRARLHELLLGYGSPVQKSVFECDLTEEQERRMRRGAAKYVRVPADTIRYYRLCGACARRTAEAGTSLSEQCDEDFLV